MISRQNVINLHGHNFDVIHTEMFDANNLPKHNIVMNCHKAMLASSELVDYVCLKQWKMQGDFK